MSQTLSLNNYGSNNLIEVARLEETINAGVSTIPLQNTEGLAAGNYIIVGTVGGEGTEALIIATVASSTSVTTTTATRFAHEQYQTIHRLFGNQIRVYRAANDNGAQPADDDFAELETVDIDFDQNNTLYTDSNGSSDYWYRFTYYNETSTAETNLSDSNAARGGGYGDYCSIESIRQDSGLHSRYITDALIDEKRQAAQAEVNSAAKAKYTVPFTAPINAAIQNITCVLAAGYLMMSQYDQFTDMHANGKEKVTWAKAQLADLKSGQLEIIGADGGSLQLPDTNTGFSGYPNADTATTTSGAEDFMFSRDMIHGYGTRQY